MSDVGHTMRRSAPPLRDTDRVRMVEEQHWDDLVTRMGGDGVYHSRAYHVASAALEPRGTVPVLLHHAGQVCSSALPFLLRPLPDGTGWDATTPYGYGGPLAQDCAQDPGLGDAVDEWAQQNHVVSSFIRYHPLIGNDRVGPPRAHPTRAGQTVVWDTRAQADLLERMHPHHRRAVRKADRAGLETRLTRAPDDLQAFRDQYELTMRRQQARAFYFFPDAYWDELMAGCADALLLVEGFFGGELVAALLCLVGPPFLHYHLGASTDAARGIGASNRLFLAAAEWARSNSLTEFHLGGGVGGSPDSSLFVFKHRFDPATAPRAFHVGRWIHDQARYRVLSEGLDGGDFFPPWRRLP